MTYSKYYKLITEITKGYDSDTDIEKVAIQIVQDYAKDNLSKKQYTKLIAHMSQSIR